MSMPQLFEIGVLPAALVVLAGMLVLYASPEVAARQRFILFLLVVSVLLCCAIYIAMRLTPEQRNEPVSQVSIFLTPTLIGVLALILTQLKSLWGMQRRARIAFLALGLGLVALLALTWSGAYVGSPYILAGALLLAFVWLLTRSRGAPLTAASVIALISLSLLNQDVLLSTTSPLPDWLRQLLGVAAWLMTVAVVPLAAVLIATGLHLVPPPGVPEPGTLARRPRLSAWLPAIFRLGLAALLLGYYAYTIVWLSIWDHTSDGLGGAMLTLPAQLTAIGAGMLMALSTTGKRRVAGALFAVLIPLLVSQASQSGWDVSYHALTEGRAARIRSGIESFYAREGRYPQVLGELVPLDLWLVEGPVILRGEDWCYQGGANFYRLAALYREFFSAPFSIHMYASAGAPPTAGWECDTRLSTLEARYQATTVEFSPPTPAPLPTSVVAVPRTPMQPVAESQNLQLGTLSPDGKYLLFGLPETDQGSRRMSLHFLDSRTGQTCQANLSFPMLPEVQEPGLRERHAWLPDGRLLFITKPGAVFTLKPCEAVVEDLSGRYAEPFSWVVGHNRTGTHIVLRGEAAYWLLDGATLQARRTEVNPNPYEFHWDRYAFSPSGEQLAISRLNGRDKTAGSNLYIVQASTGHVLHSLPLADAYDQSAPMVEWLTDDELLLHGQDTLSIIDFKSNPPIIKNVLRDFFNLDIAYPNDISSISSFPASNGKTYHLAVRVNHPRDKALYVYHSETGKYEVLHPEGQALLILPDGQFADMRLLEEGPTYRDEYDLIWVDAPGKPAGHIVVQGHAPRNYAMLDVAYLPVPSQFAFGSSQGVSLHAIPGGETLAFWELGNGISTYLFVPTGGKSLIAFVEREGLYYLPLPSH